MATALAWMTALVGLMVVGSLAFNVAVYAAAARAAGASECPFDDDEIAPPIARALAFARECVATVLVLLPSLRRPRSRPATTRTPVVLVPGYGLSGRSLGTLARRLRRDGWEVHAVPRMRGWTLARRAACVEQAIERVRAASGAERVDVVAHGVGGLAVRALVRHRGRASGVRRLVTLGTPHRGTDALPFLPFPGLDWARPDAAALAGLAEDDPVPALVDVIALYSAADALIRPAEAAYYPGAFNIRLDGVGHFSLVRAARVYELVRENLTADPPASGSP